MQADSQGNVWLAAWFDLWKWDGATWTTVVQPTPNYFFDLGGINAFAIGPDDVLWFGTNDGLVRWDGVDFTLFTTGNSPLPAKQVQRHRRPARRRARPVSCLQFGSVTPFPTACASSSGDPATRRAGRSGPYGT